MFGFGLTLFTVFGIKVKVDVGWAIVATLIAWTLAQGVFPQVYEGLPSDTYWWMAIVAVIGLAFSIIVHELAHSLVGRAFGIPIESITLFMFGGVAELHEEPGSPPAEFFMAVAGPLASVAMALGFGVAERVGGDTVLASVFGYLSLLNFILAVFNMLPAFPLDGGRVFRAAMWWATGDVRRATHMAARAGHFFGWALVALGFVAVLSGELVGGLWWILIGLFIRSAAEGARLQIETSHLFKGVPVQRYMTREPAAATPELTLRRFVDECVYRHHQERFPVARDHRALGTIGLDELKRLPRDQWDDVTVGEAMTPLSHDTAVTAEDDAAAALAKMRESGFSRLPVVDSQERLVGDVALQDLLALVSLTMQLDTPNARRRA